MAAGRSSGRSTRSRRRRPHGTRLRKSNSGGRGENEDRWREVRRIELMPFRRTDRTDDYFIDGLTAYE